MEIFGDIHFSFLNVDYRVSGSTDMSRVCRFINIPMGMGLASEATTPAPLCQLAADAAGGGHSIGQCWNAV